MICYLGPEVMMPLLSALAAIGGLVLAFGRRLAAVARKILGLFCRRQPQSAESGDEPAAAIDAPNERRDG